MAAVKGSVNAGIYYVIFEICNYLKAAGNGFVLKRDLKVKRILKCGCLLWLFIILFDVRFAGVFNSYDVNMFIWCLPACGFSQGGNVLSPAGF